MAAAGRLTFLYPQLLRAATRGSGPTWGWAAAASTTTTTTTARWNSSFAKRRGKGVEPTEWEKQQQQQQQQKQQEQQDQDLPTKTTADGTAADKLVEDEPAEALAKSDIGKLYFQEGENKAAHDAVNDAPEADAAALKSQQPEPKATQNQADTKPLESTNADADTAPSSQPRQATDPGDSTASSESKTSKPKDGTKMSDKLDTVFYMGAPENMSQQQPSMAPPKYVHHFDSYSLVKQLQEGGYTNDQAITMMKAIRTILADNLDMAQERLVSKSDVENVRLPNSHFLFCEDGGDESYLFSAACSELSAEIKNNRRAQDEQIRQQRTHLQHEVDILTQTLNQELLTLNDNVRGIFNDRKMTVREEQKAAESAIQQINYKISIMLSSDSKSEIEGVRWILIRRSVVGILFMAILTLGTIRYATYVSHERQRELDRKKKEEEELRRDGGKSDRTSAPDAAAILAAN
ncbi:moz represents a chromatin-associated acetyltransferase [Trichoderma arundinaceum]|uniref:Moz represents a chromatin-associated acetyltransferase n=1 Tax=Trichoderma arundinaceum TaxID=490622 RepID=A0A395NGV0_TRIAR|nr:moz represents a chromatin-associated acetyltransferase [Trichoderma arundinaceum]